MPYTEEDRIWFASLGSMIPENVAAFERFEFRKQLNRIVELCEKAGYLVLPRSATAEILVPKSIESYHLVKVEFRNGQMIALEDSKPIERESPC
jgi:hypothetical protein